MITRLFYWWNPWVTCSLLILDETKPTKPNKSAQWKLQQERKYGVQP
jgi:hypothetical protein